MAEAIKLIECPRDAMQGWKQIIPAQVKIDYLQSLVQVGFDTIDAGSLVSPKAMPQMADSAEVFNAIDLGKTSTKLLCIVGNARGAREACTFDNISYIGFPFSLSETFQQRNTNASMAEAFMRVEEIITICRQHGKIPVVYLSMGFGNPYGDPYSSQLVVEWAKRLADTGAGILSLADTVGLATADEVFSTTHEVIGALPETEIGVHLHSSPANWQPKLQAALDAGCTRIDGALRGIGGCPMAGDDLVGNMDSELMISYLQERGLIANLDQTALQRSIELATAIFSSSTIHS